MLELVCAFGPGPDHEEIAEEDGPHTREGAQGASPDWPTALWSLVGLRPGLPSGGSNRKRRIARKPNPGDRSADGVSREDEILYRAVTRSE
jgi:hypothetical protein